VVMTPFAVKPFVLQKLEKCANEDKSISASEYTRFPSQPLCIARRTNDAGLFVGFRSIMFADFDTQDDPFHVLAKDEKTAFIESNVPRSSSSALTEIAMRQVFIRSFSGTGH